LLEWQNVDDPTAAALAKLNAAMGKSEQCVVFANANILARVHLGAALTDENCARGDLGAVKHFDA